MVLFDQPRSIDRLRRRMFVFSEYPGPKVRSRRVHGERDLDRPVSRQLLDEGFVEHGSVGCEAKQVRKELPADQPEDFEKLRMQEGFPLGDFARKAVAEAYGLPIVLIHQRKLQFDVLEIPEKPPGNRKGIQVV
jgi:hypothetical protein